MAYVTRVKLDGYAPAEDFPKHASYSCDRLVWMARSLLPGSAEIDLKTDLTEIGVDVEVSFHHHVKTFSRTAAGSSSQSLSSRSAADSRRDDYAMSHVVEGALLSGIAPVIAKDPWKVMDDEWRLSLAKDNDAACHTETCGSCGGHGQYQCRKCSASGRVVCWGCNGYGVQNCNGCGGSGTYFDTGNQQTRNCPTCLGRRQIDCRSCYGNKYLTCLDCNGHGYLNCTPCGQSGYVTYIAGYEVFAVASKHVTVRNETDPVVEDEIETWVKLGMEGSAESRLTASFSKPEIYGDEKEGAKMLVSFGMTKTITEGTAGGHIIHYTSVAFPVIYEHNAMPFADNILMETSVKLKHSAAASADAYEMFQTAKTAGDLPMLIAESVRSKNGTQSLRKDLLVSYSGALSEKGIASVEEPLADAKLAATKSASKRPETIALTVSILAAAIFYLFDLSDTLLKSMGGGGLFFTAACALLIWGASFGAARLAASRKLRQSLGEGTRASNAHAPILPFAGIAILLAAVFVPITDGVSREAADGSASIRSMIGIDPDQFSAIQKSVVTSAQTITDLAK